jgi:ATP-binding cassette subfamily B protein
MMRHGGSPTQRDGKHNTQVRFGPGAHMRMPEKPKDARKTWLQLIQYCRRYLPVMTVAFMLAAIAAAAAVFIPDIMRSAADEVEKGLFGSIDMAAFLGIVALLIWIHAGAAIASYIQHYMMATATGRLSMRMRADISGKINRLPLKYFDKTSFGDVISRVTNDVDAVGQTLGQSIAGVISSATIVLGSMAMMFVVNWVMALTAIGTSIFGMALTVFIMSKSRKHFVAQQKQLGEINGHIEEIYSGHNVVKAYNGGRKAREAFEKINDGLYESGWKSQFLTGLMMPIMHFVGNLGYVAVCVIGAALTIRGTISFGVIIAFILYVRFFSQNLSQIAQSMQVFQRTAAAAERIFEFLGEAELSDESHKPAVLETAAGRVEFRNVHFGYDPEKPVIHDFSALVAPGQKVAIVGPTGAGKTTMVNLLMRFYELDSGAILLDGIPISDMRRADVHRQFGMVLQDTWVFDGTIRDNIVYSQKDVTDEQVVQACKAVGMHHYIRTLPDGYDTLLDDKSSLSAGQRQLLTIARAMIQNAPLMILDEATSSVDTRTERIVQRAMDALTAGRTSFVIAHRLSTIKNADLILVMRDGDIVESGQHTELLGRGGFYAELYNAQFENAEAAV